MQTYLTPDPIVCEIRNSNGSVSIDLTDTPTTTVELLPAEGATGFLDDVLGSMWGGPKTPTGEPADDVVVEFADNKLMVDTEPARRTWHTGFVVRITAPIGSGIRTRTESANIAVTGKPDRVELKTASGTLDVAMTGPNTLLRTVSGDIEVRDADAGSLDAAAVSGSLNVGVHQGVAAKVDLATVAGKARSELTVQRHLDSTSLTIKGRTVSGNITLRSAQA